MNNLFSLYIFDRIYKSISHIVNAIWVLASMLILAIVFQTMGYKGYTNLDIILILPFSLGFLVYAYFLLLKIEKLMRKSGVK